MAARPFWKGYLKLSLVTCPVAMSPALSERAKVRFHTLNAETGHRIETRYVDSETGKPVTDDDQVRGYPVEEDKYIILEDEELEAVALESTRTIEIEGFVDRDEVGWTWLDRAHYLTPDDKVGEEAFSVIREAMKAADKVALSRLVLYRREHPVMLEPRDKGIILWTLRYGDELRAPDAYFEHVDGGKPDAKALKLMESLIADRSTEWAPGLAKDPVQEQLVKIIARKKKKGARKPAGKSAHDKPQPTADNVVSIMDALRKSVASERKAR